MELLSPWSLAWLALLAPLIALYILKRRRARKVVASTLLWEAAMRDLRAERPWQRLRPHLSLLLQALALIAGALALARPIGAAPVLSGARLAVVIDASASMGARDGDGTRLDRARERALAMARSLPPDGEMMLVVAGAQPEVLASASRDRVELERALERLALRGSRADLEAAVGVAAERMREAPVGSRIVVLTDAALSGTVTLAATVPVEVQRVGETQPNHAIVAVDVRARPEPDAPDRADVFVRIARFGEGSADVRVDAAIDGGAPLGSRRITVTDGAPQSVVLPVDLPPDAAGRAAFVRASITTLDGEDGLALDDVAVAPSPAARRLPVFLVGNAPPSVRRVLRADPEVELFATDLEALAREREANPDAPELDGLFVYAGPTPSAPPAGDSLVFAPTGARVFEVELGAAVPRPSVISWDETDARMRFLRLSDVHLADVRPIQGGAAHALLTTDAGTVIAAVERADGETTLVSFDPDAGDWSAQPSFVIFVRNLLERARRRRADGGIAPGALGEPLRVPAPDGAEVRIETPGGRVRLGRSRGGVAVVEVPAEPGVYRARFGGRERQALRNLLDADESDLRARAVFTQADGREATLREEAAPPTELWPWIAGALLVLLVLEALWATRKGAAA
jgi:hypothetical protein